MSQLALETCLTLLMGMLNHITRSTVYTDTVMRIRNRTVGGPRAVFMARFYTDRIRVCPFLRLDVNY